MINKMIEAKRYKMNLELFDLLKNRKEYAERLLAEIKMFRRLLKSDLIPNYIINSKELETCLKQYIKHFD